MNFRLLALDLDGTLLDDHGSVSPRDAQALQAAASRGMHIIFSSGRMSAAVRRYPDSLGIDGPIISYNGAMARDSRARAEAVLFHLPLSAEYADELIAYARAERFHLNYYLDECLYACEDPELRRFADLYHQQTGSIFHFVPDLERFKGSAPTKIILITDPSDPAHPNPRHRDELYRFWQERWGSQVGLLRTNPQYLEFTHRDANKGVALEAVARRLGVPREQVIAIGDGRNDISMIEWAGLGVAVANAHPEVKAAARYLSPCTNNDSPVSEVLEEWGGCRESAIGNREIGPR